MTKSEIIEKLTAAANGSDYGMEVVKELDSKPITSDAKYHQDAKDRLDERLAEVKMWAAKDLEKGDTAKAEVDNQNAAILEAMIKAI